MKPHGGIASVCRQEPRTQDHMRVSNGNPSVHTANQSKDISDEDNKAQGVVTMERIENTKENCTFHLNHPTYAAAGGKFVSNDTSVSDNMHKDSDREVEFGSQ
ncbi:hypothetical protein CRENBAI_007652 [Crenichthys baileyi]|uniref:Uncharacterized protein n=1 Tax=Crenichthys baileyi TaxID=28760 RepID=A0AAV9SEG4_9TELE